MKGGWKASQWDLKLEMNERIKKREHKHDVGGIEKRISAHENEQANIKTANKTRLTAVL